MSLRYRDLHVVRIGRYNGGQSADDTEGPVGSFAKGEQLDFRSAASVVQLTPQMTEQSGGVVDDLILDAALTPNGDIFFIGNTGKLYRRDTDTGNWTLVADLGENSGGSIFYRSDQDALLIPLQTKVAYYGPVSNKPVVDVNRYANSTSVDTLAYRSGGSASYTLPIAGTLSESNTAKCEFQADIEPLISINVKILTKPSGSNNLSIYVHDDANTQLGFSTILSADMQVGQWNRIDFTVSGTASPVGPYRLLVKPNARTYHFHVTSSDGTGTIAVATADDLSTADFQIEAPRFVTTRNTLHPAIQFLQYNVYLNERYVAVHEPLETVATNQEFQRHRLTFPSGFEGCGVALYREYLAIAVERQNNGSLEYQNGIIFLWNGFDATYTDAIPIPEGSPRSLFSFENELYWQADGSWYTLNGRKPERVRRFPGATEEFTGVYAQTTVNPNMSTVRKGVLLAGFPSNTNDQTMEYGVYSLGSLDRTYDHSFGLDYYLSSGSRLNNGTNNLTIGMVKDFGDELYVSWRDDSTTHHYGVDSVSPYSQAATAGRFESLWFDAGLPEHEQINHRMKLICQALPAGCTLTPIWRTERGGVWTNENGALAQATAGQKEVVLAIDQRTNEIQLGFIIATTGSNVKVRTTALEYDPLILDEHF